MTSDYRRVVAGYPKYIHTFGVGDLALNESAIFNLAAGPGEVLGWTILRYGGTVGDFRLMTVKIEIDGVTLYNSYMCYLFAQATNLSAQGMFATSHHQAASLSTHSFQFRMPYAISCRLTFTNTAANVISCGWSIYYRRGE